jgi:hypothetical protein
MQQQGTRWHSLAVLAVLAGCGLRVLAGGEPKRRNLRPLPPGIVKAWTDTGAKVGWIRLNQNGVFLFQEKSEAGAIPAFRLSNWKEGVLAKLPHPGTAFGLDLNSTGVTDAGLKELAKLTNLRALNLQKTEVTDAGLRALAGLKNLQSLDLFGTAVTDDGVQPELPGRVERLGFFQQLRIVQGQRFLDFAGHEQPPRRSQGQHVELEAIEQTQDLLGDLLHLGVALGPFLGFFQDSMHVLQLLVQPGLHLLVCGNHLPEVVHPLGGHAFDMDAAQPVVSGQAAERGEVLQLHQLDLQEMLLIAEVHFVLRDRPLPAQLQGEQVARDIVEVAQVDQAPGRLAVGGNNLDADHAGQMAEQVRDRPAQVIHPAFVLGVVFLDGLRRGRALLLDAAAQVGDTKAQGGKGRGLAPAAPALHAGGNG